MTTASEPIAAPTVRELQRWGIPLHYAIPVGVALVGVLLLLLGGAPAFLGGWWLATALPIAIGGFVRKPWFALAPVALWIAWLIIGAAAGPDAALANTPVPIAIFLAAVGGGATLVAQRAIFPATDPDAWDAHAAGDGDGDGDRDDEPESQLTGVHDTLAATELDVDDDADLDPALSEIFEDTELESEDADDGTDADDADAEADDAPDAEAEADPEPETDAGVESTDDDQPEAAAPLDEGGHVTEFQALSEADLAEPR